LNYCENVVNMLFKDRLSAGKALIKPLEKYKGEDVIVLGIPRGGVPIGYSIAKALDAPLDVIIPRKLPIPWSPEVGFGAVTSTGDVILNPDIAGEIRLSDSEIKAIADDVYKEIQRRMKIYRGNKPLPSLREKSVIIADDGLATGFTMIAAIESVRKQGPKKVIAAAPVSPKDAADKIRKYADEVVTIWEKQTCNFAVASFYEDFHDMSDEEVTRLLAEF
jgi:putative phosphoribosyl transferase